MKAITCTQCGALIKRISLSDKFAVCDYCGAKILLEDNKEKIIEVPNNNALKYTKMNAPDYSSAQNVFTVGKIFLVIGIFVFAIIIIFITGKSAIDRRSNSKEKTLAATATPYAYATPFKFADNVVYPKINYNVDVKWIGDNDMEHYEVPSIDESKLTTSDTKELKKTVFKNRSVQVKVTISEDGEVTEAKAVSGHPILKEAAENAAKKTLFANRRKPANRNLTYIFRLISE